MNKQKHFIQEYFHHHQYNDAWKCFYFNQHFYNLIKVTLLIITWWGSNVIINQWGWQGCASYNQHSHKAHYFSLFANLKCSLWSFFKTDTCHVKHTPSYNQLKQLRSMTSQADVFISHSAVHRCTRAWPSAFYTTPSVYFH